MNAKDRLIVALDVDDQKKAENIIDVLSDEVDIFKVGIAPFTDYGQAILDKLSALGKKVFLDLKFHDIPNTVKNAAIASVKKKVFMMNFHCVGGRKMLEAAVSGVQEGCVRYGNKAPITLGVTVLTSMAEEDLRDIGIKSSVREKVEEFAQVAADAGLNGVVASAKEARMIKEKIGEEFVVVTPGVRPEWAVAGDQKRVLTPNAAIAEGADYIVIGRPIIYADDPRAAAKRIIEEMEKTQ